MFSSKTVLDKGNIINRIERLPITGYILLIISVAAIGNFFDIFNLDSLGAVLPVINKQFSLTGFYSSQLVASLFIGMFVGSIIIGLMVDRVGRKPIFNATLIVLAVGTILAGLAQNYAELYAGRFISGVGVGGDFAAVWAYFNELVPSSSRGRYYAIALGIGIMSIPAVTFLAAYLVAVFPVNGWRYLFLFSAIVALAVLPLRAYAPESPRFYLIKEQYDKAEAQMKKIEDSVKRRYGRELPAPKTNSMSVVSIQKGQLGALFSKQNNQRYKTTMLTLVWIFQTWGFYGFTAFIVLILYEKGFSIVHSITFSGIGFIGGILGPFLLAALIGDKRLQRRYALILWAVIAGVLDIILAFTNTVVAIIVLAFLINMIQQAFATNLHSYTPEMFPNSLRGTGGGFADGVGRLLFAIGSLTVVALLQGKPVDQLVFVGISWMLTALFAFLAKYNTNLKNLEELTEPTAQTGRAMGASSAATEPEH